MNRDFFSALYVQGTRLCYFVFFSEHQVPEPSGRKEPLDITPQLGWEEQRDCSGPDQQDSSEDRALLTLDRPQSLAEAERLFDELTQEKLQVCLRVCYIIVSFFSISLSEG